MKFDSRPLFSEGELYEISDFCVTHYQHAIFVFVLMFNNYRKEKTRRIHTLLLSLTTHRVMNKLTTVPCRLSQVILGDWAHQMASNPTAITH